MRVGAGHRRRARRRVRRQAAEQAVHLVLHARGEVYRIGVARRAVIARDQLPQVRDHDRVAARVGQVTDKLVILQVIRFDSAVAEVADQQIAAKRTEARRRNGEAPG